jgi:SagB-type dehydrogenase family enzyme
MTRRIRIKRAEGDIIRKRQFILQGIIIVVCCLFLIKEDGISMAQIKQIQLPKPRTSSEVSLEEAILKRRSQRQFIQKEISLQELGQLLWAAQGITKDVGFWKFRTAPSAGSLYPMEVYVVTKDGVYHYIPEKHIVEVLSEKDLRNDLSHAALGQEPVREAAADFVICSVYARVMSKYGRRGIRYAHIEAGHVAQNLLLEAVALGLGAVPIGAFDDERVQRVLSLPKDHEPLYIIPVGYIE